MQPGDIILLYTGGGLGGWLLNWLLGSPFCHCMICWVETKRGLPLIIESVGGKGVVIMPLLVYQGKGARVMRWAGPDAQDVGERAAKAAEGIADRRDSFYDYLAIARFVIPRLVLERLGIGMPAKWHKNPLYMCSELVAQAYSDAGYPVLPEHTVPLPGDFATSDRLDEVWDGTIEDTLWR
jgi:hypothetical protein